MKHSYFSLGVSRLPNGSNCVYPEQNVKKMQKYRQKNVFLKRRKKIPQILLILLDI